MRNWLQLSDSALLEKIDQSEKNSAESDTTCKDFHAVREHLSRLAWNSYAAALNCDNGPISKVGVAIHPLGREIADRLMAAYEQSRPMAMKRDDFAIGYVANRTQASCDHLNRANTYREMTPGLTEAVGLALKEVAPIIETDIGHPFRVASIRAFDLTPSTGIEGRHLDGWPPSIRKVFLLPKGANRRTGTTWFRRRDGTEIVVDNDEPMMVVFENSVVWHAPQPSSTGRPTVEIIILPTALTEARPYYAGINGSYPWFPTDAALLEGTRMAAQIASATGGRGLWQRLLLR
jgi:hypothetical protein